MYSVAGFLKTTKCSLNGHFLSEFLIKAESRTLNHSSVKNFLRKSMLTQSCGFLGHGHTSAIGAPKEFQLFLGCNFLYSCMYSLVCAHQCPGLLLFMEGGFLGPLPFFFSHGSVGSLFLDLDLDLALVTARLLLLSMPDSPA